MLVKNAALALASTALIAGCAADVERDFATAAVTSSLETPRKEQASRELVEPRWSCDTTAEEAAADAAARPQVGLFPDGCASKLATGPDVHVDYQGCTGAFGRVQLDGGVDAHFESVDACMLRATVKDSGDLTANAEALDYDAVADIAVGESEHHVTLASEWSGTTPRGQDVHQKGTWDVVIEDETTCLDFAGSAAGAVGETPYEISVEQLSICPSACPSHGLVRASWEGKWRENEVTIEFDGSDVARVTGWSGRVFDVPMVCGDAAVADGEARAE